MLWKRLEFTRRLGNKGRGLKLTAERSCWFMISLGFPKER